MKSHSPLLNEASRSLADSKHMAVVSGLDCPSPVFPDKGRGCDKSEP